MILTDLSKMPFGKFAGKPMMDVPVAYLHWLWTKGGLQHPTDTKGEAVKDYVESNLEALKMENKDLIWS